MARTDTFQNWATDVADSIREKTGKTDKIPAAEFDTEITAIQTKEDLDAELTVQNEEITEQETSLINLMSKLEGKAGVNIRKITPTTLSFKGYTGVELKGLENIDLGNLDNIDSMFYQCKNITQLDLNSWDTSKIINMNNTFQECTNLTYLNVKGWDTSNVTNLLNTFRFCKNLIELDLSGWSIPNVVNLTGTFDGCSSLRKLDIRNWQFKTASYQCTYSYTFTGIPTDCLIIVKDDSARSLILSKRSDFTNIKTVAELEG